MNAQSWNCSYINNEDHRAFAGGRFGGRPGSWAMERKLRGWPHDHGPLVRVEMGRHCRRVREISRTQRVCCSFTVWMTTFCLYFLLPSGTLECRSRHPMRTSSSCNPSFSDHGGNDTRWAAASNISLPVGYNIFFFLYFRSQFPTNSLHAPVMKTLSYPWSIVATLSALGKFNFFFPSTILWRQFWNVYNYVLDRIYVDCVFNQMTPGTGTGTGGSSVNGGSMSYPGNKNIMIKIINLM